MQYISNGNIKIQDYFHFEKKESRKKKSTMTPPVKETPVQAVDHVAKKDVPDRDTVPTPTLFANVKVKSEALKSYGSVITGGEKNSPIDLLEEIENIPDVWDEHIAELEVDLGF